MYAMNISIPIRFKREFKGIYILAIASSDVACSTLPDQHVRLIRWIKEVKISLYRPALIYRSLTYKHSNCSNIFLVFLRCSYAWQVSLTPTKFWTPHLFVDNAWTLTEVPADVNCVVPILVCSKQSKSAALTEDTATVSLLSFVVKANSFFEEILQTTCAIVWRANAPWRTP